MRDACIRAASNAMGRALRPEEARDIETKVARHMRLMAASNPSEWSAKSEEERFAEAGAAAAKDIVAEARRRKTNLETRIVRMEALNNFVDAQVADGKDQYRLDALSRVLAPKADAAGTPEGGAVDQKAQGIYGHAVSSLMDVFEAGKRRGIWRFIPFNEPGTNRLLRQALAGQDAPPEFKRMADLAHDYINIMVRRYNAAGGAIGRLEDWGEPHRWSDVLVLRAIKAKLTGIEGPEWRVGARRNKAAKERVKETPFEWEMAKREVAREFAEAADRRKYVHEDGRPMTMDEITVFMNEALSTIVSDGANKRLAGERPDYAVSVAANRHRSHREIHLRNDAVAGMLDKYSELGALESLLLHMRSLARDVALIETFGPNAELTARQMMQEAFDRDSLFFPENKNELVHKRDHAEYLFDYLAGNAQGRRNAFNATMSFLRSWATFKSLGFTVWSSLTDPVIMQHVAWARGLDQGKLWVNDVKLAMGSGRRWAKRAGLITDTVAGYADRLSFDHLAAPDVGARAASFTLKATWLNWVTESRRAAYGTTMMDAIGHLVKYNESLGAIKAEDDRTLLNLLNVSEDTWAVWRMAKLESMGGNHTLLSPQSIHAIPDGDIVRLMPDAEPDLVRHNAATQLLGIVKDETNTAIITAGSRERAAMLGDQTKSGAGTIGGELRRAFVLFRSFPWTFMTRQWELAKSIDGGGNRAAYAASLIVSTWMVGILVNWIYDLWNGRDPGAIDPTSAEGRRNIISGLARGGGLGIAHDFLFANSDPNNRSQSIASTMTGPVLSQIDEVQQLTLGNLNQAATGQETNIGPEAVRFAQRQAAPNWFYSKALMERYIFNALQEELEPGYTSRRMRREFQARGTSYYWSPAEPADIREPDWTRALEGDMPERAN